MINALFIAPYEISRPRGLLMKYCSSNNIDILEIIKQEGKERLGDIHENRCTEILNNLSNDKKTKELDKQMDICDTQLGPSGPG